MILEYKTNNHTWNMVDGDISFCYYHIEDEIKRIKEKNDKEKWNDKILELAKAKTLEAGFFTDYPNKGIFIWSEKEWHEIKEIYIVVISRRNNHEVFVFDHDYFFRILYNDGTIIREYGKNNGKENSKK